MPLAGAWCRPHGHGLRKAGSGGQRWV